jgi:hypothetical protein
MQAAAVVAVTLVWVAAQARVERAAVELVAQAHLWLVRLVLPTRAVAVEPVAEHSRLTLWLEQAALASSFLRSTSHENISTDGH